MKKNEIDMCSGSLFGKMLKFTIPIILTVVLQQLFNTADLVVVGKFGRSGALAAVGATGAAVSLLINFFNGFSLGAGICMARHYGAKNNDCASDCVHTSVALSVVAGTLLAVIAIIATPALLSLMGTPDDVINDAVLYMRIYFAGMPFIMLFNFCASILRAVGDSRRTLIYISSAGVINVILNIIFVTALDLNVAGVAAATVISQAYAAIMCIRCFLKYDGCLKLDVKMLKIDLGQLKSIAAIGIPSGIQGTLFSISNVLIQSSINSFGTAVMSGTTAAGNIDGYIYLVMNSVSSTTANFTGQNFGAKNFPRIKRVILLSCLMTSFLGVVLGITANVFGAELIGIYTSGPAEIAAGLTRLKYVGLPYFLCGIMEVFSGSFRGMNHSFSSMIISLMGACVFRIIWIYTVFERFRTIDVLFLSYPVTWLITALVLAVLLTIIIRREELKLQPRY